MRSVPAHSRRASRGGNLVKSNMVNRCARTWYTHLQSANAAIQQLAGMGIELCDSEIPVASEERIAVFSVTEFYVFSDHRLADIYLKMCKSDVAPAVHFDHMVFAAVLVITDPVRVFSSAADVQIRRT